MGRVLPPAILTLVVLFAGMAARADAAGAASPAARFDAPGQAHAIACATLAGSPRPLRFADAVPTGFSVTNQLSFDDGRCASGTVRLDLHELIPSPAGPLAFHRGGNGYADDQNVKYGELATADLAPAPPPPVPSSGGRGAECRLAAEPAYRVQVRSIPDAMHYKRPQDVAGGNNKGASFMHYGDPGADQGDRHDIHYSYLVWSFVDVRGGGMVRTLLAPGQVVRACDVESVTMDAWDRAGAVDGQVTARYVQTFAGSCPIYGWMAWTHDDLADAAGPVAHAVPAAAGDPGAQPPSAPPGPSCPVAEPASPPVVATGDATAGGEPSTWTVAGTANPKGVPTTWWIEYGAAAAYGSATPAGALPATDRVDALNAPLAGLSAGTTYHYRVVAASLHGTAYGPDRTLTTAAPPPVVESVPAAPAEPPPAPQRLEPAAVRPARLTGLGVVPRTFRRSRSAHGGAARIRYALSVPGTVRLSFLRASAGMRAGGSCVPAPRRGVPRGRRRCTAWIARGGTLTRRASAGPGELRFGGWVGTHALPAGRYRLSARPLDAAGRVGPVRTAGFSLR
jgi:hypothetical protein